MAYVRSGLHSLIQPNILTNETDSKSKSNEYHDFDEIPSLKTDKERRKSEGYKLQKPLVIFTFNISFLSPLFRYLVLAFGMFFFMCLYGYFQELVVYGWFNRKLSLFCTFLHFLGCSFFAQLQYNYSGRAPSSTSVLGTPKSTLGTSKNASNNSLQAMQGMNGMSQLHQLTPGSHLSQKIMSLSSTLLTTVNANEKTFKGKIVSYFIFFKNLMLRIQVCFLGSLLFHYLFSIHSLFFILLLVFSPPTLTLYLICLFLTLP